MAGLEIRREDLNLPSDQKGRLAFMLYNVLTPEECKQLIKKSERKGFEQALVKVGGREMLMKDVRNCARCLFDSVEDTEKIWQRIRDHIPTDWNGYTVVGINEKLKILRYDAGQYFKPHYDGNFQRPNGDKSFITLQIYLNEGFEGGSTTFLPADKNPEPGIEVVPKTGMVLVFQHNIFHEGSLLKKGKKYSVRTEVMYRKLNSD